jgi:hypothetical protein
MTQGTNVLADIGKEGIIQHAFRQLRRPVQPGKLPLWDGPAGKRIIEILARYLDEHQQFISPGLASRPLREQRQ